MSQALSLIAAAKTSRATTLDLGNCGLTELPEELFELTWLEALILSSGWQEYDPIKKQWAIKESQNVGEPNRIASIAGLEALGVLKKLVVASWVEEWELSDLSPLAALNQLQTLNCSDTQVSDLAPLAALNQLQTLECRNTQVSDLAPLAALNQLQTLYCSDTQVSDLSPLAALNQLLTLDCSYTQVSDLSPLAALNQLLTLECRNTQVSDLAPLAVLNQLQTLYCSYTRVSDLSPLAALNQLLTLECYSTQVSDLSPLAALNQLLTLECYSTRVSDLSPLAALTQLQTLECYSTQVSDLSPLAALNQLQTLNCSDTQVSDLSPLAALNQLLTLECYSTQVSDLAPLAALNQLQTLECRNTQVSDLSPLAALNQLQTLYCSGTQVSDLSPLAALNQLQTLYCSYTRVSDLSPLAALTQLQTLDCSYTQVSDLSPLAALNQLQALYCSDTQVSDLSPLAALNQLQTLECYYTQVSDLSPLAALTQLQTLECYSTQVSDLAPLAALNQLQTLFCYSTQVSDLSPLKTLANLQKLYVRDCPIQNIPKEIYDEWDCAQALFTYWQELQTAQKTKNNQLKVMFLGNGCVGKSTLLHWFLNKEFTPISLEEGRTHGIFIKPYAFENSAVLAHFWDFGGQEVFHATHRLFLGRRSLYVLLWATESPEPNGDLQHPPEYWLDMIADIADRHERSRVLIVQNLFEGQKERNILSDAERAEYETRGLDITTYCVNAKTGLKVKTVMTAIEEEAQHLLNTYREELPETWVNIRAAVAERRFKGGKMLPQADFEAICRDCGLATSPSVMLDYLHRAGELFYYRDQFENQIILDQEWALKAVYAILKRKNIETFKGRMRREQLVQMWQSDGLIQAKEEAEVFLNFMMANKIAFYTEKKHWEIENPELVIPQLLPTETPEMYSLWADIPDKLGHRIAYQFLHRDIIERFIVQTAHLSEKKEYWRNGLFINYLGSKAVVEVVPIEGEKDKKQIQIGCTGTAKQEFLRKIREEFNKIRTLEKASEWRFEKGQWINFSSKIHLEPGQSGGFDLPLPNHIIASKTVETSMKDHLLNLIAAGHLKEALDAMRQIEQTQSKYFKDPLIGLLARYNRNERSKNEGVIALSDYQLELNKIGAATRSFLDSDMDERAVPGDLRSQILEAGKAKLVEPDPKGRNNTNPTNKPKVYFSYAWGDDKEAAMSREKIVQDLYDELKKEGYPVRRDKEEVGYKDSIEEFMKEIGRGSFIVVTISDKYLKSANCMFELLQIYRKSNSDFSEFKDKIFPIGLGDAKIYDPLDVLDYAAYWQEKKNKLEEKIKVVGLAAASGVMADFDKFNEITNNIAQISRMISSINTLKPTLLSDNNFAEIKKAIAEKVQG